MKARPIVVIGSTNMDLVVKAKRFPRPGETMSGESFYTSYGGKGANQAVAVARLAVPSAFIGCVGNDAFGKEMVEHLHQEGVDVSNVRTIENCPSGTALIVVDSEGRNEIIVVRGANGLLRPHDIQKAEQIIASAKIIVLQLEIPLDTVYQAVETAQKHAVPVILNPAPAPVEPLDPDVLKHVFMLVPNEIEAEALTEKDAVSLDSAREAVQLLLRTGVKKVIITRGEDGSIFSDGSGIVEIPAYRVKAEDSTGAGDAFVGALAAGYVCFSDFTSLLKFASAVAAISVTKRGAQSSLPGRQEVYDFLKKNEPSLLDEFMKMERAYG